MNRRRVEPSRRSGRWPWGLSVAAAWFFLTALLMSCATPRRLTVSAPDIPGATFVGNQVCADCHTNIVRKFSASAHSRLQAMNAAMPDQSGCESCHGPGSLHAQAGGAGTRWIVNPGKDPTACLDCHIEIRAEFRQPFHHQVLEGRMSCVQCHDPHGADVHKPASGLAMARLNEACANCHREQSRPFVFEHEALRDGCTVCHRPHGSFNRKMLTDADQNLCLRCHAQVQGVAGSIFIGKINHTLLLTQGSCWAAGCHSSIHGSNVDPRMRF